MTGGYVTFEQPDDGFIYVYAYTARGQRVQNVVRADAPADRVIAAAAMVWRRRQAWDRLQGGAL